MEMEARAQCALVLGGGGPLGIAWEAGMLEGWAAGWAKQAGNAALGSNGQRDPHSSALSDPMAALLSGRIIGTSAGSIVGAHLAAHDGIAALYRRQADPPGPEAPPGPKMAAFMAAFMKAKFFSRGVQGLRRSMGKSARRRALPGEAEWVDAIARWYAPEGPWPAERDLIVTAIDAESGEFHAWNRNTGVPLALAIAASCAVPCAFPLVPIGDRLYMDGGIGSSTNANLAEGCERVLILDPLGRMAGASAPLEQERRALEESGSRTLAFTPDQAVADAIGTHMLDASRRGEVALLGREQGLMSAPSVRTFLMR